MSANKPRPITAEYLLSQLYTMVAIEPRYTPAKVFVAFGPQQQHFFDMVDTLTDGGDEPMHVEAIFRDTDFMPYGYGDTLEEAIKEALDRVNKIYELPEEQQEYAWIYIHNVSSLPKGVTTYEGIDAFDVYYQKETDQ